MVGEHKMDGFARFLMELKGIEARRFSADWSPIAQHIQLLALSLPPGRRPYSIKDFCAILPYSEERISQLIHKMVQEGWLIMLRSRVDKRVKHVAPSPLLFQFYREYEREVEKSLRQYIANKFRTTVDMPAMTAGLPAQSVRAPAENGAADLE